MNFEERAKELVSKMTLQEKMFQLRYDASAIERLGVPEYNWWNECLHGVARAGTATVFPQAIGMAASFDDNLVYEIADSISDEARAKYNEYKKMGKTLIYQGLTYWSPNINIFRDPRWGRGHETYGECPCLTGRMGAAFVKGLQGNGKYRKLDATIKHFAVHSGPESLRHGFNAVVDKTDLYETYLPAFKYCIDNAKPAAVMGGYNAVNGEACCASKTLLQDILRDEFGFDGYVVSDCGAICDINTHHHITETAAESAALAVKNGCDLNCGSAYQYLTVALDMGLVNEDDITQCVERLFTARFKLGMFDNDCEYDNISIDVVESKEHIELNRKAAQKSIVMLKNDGILPLKSGLKLAVIGPNADDISVLLGNYNGTPSIYSTFLRGIQNNYDGKIYYARGCHAFMDSANQPWAEQPTNEAVLAAMRSDVVIMCMGLNPTMEGEEGDAYNGCNSGDKTDLELPEVQRQLINKIIALGKPIVFVNISGSAINLSIEDEKCNAVLQCFYPGAEGGNALADILFGKTSPSGRLPVTFYRSADDLPAFEDYSMKNRTYRFFEGKPLYEFGYGLNYADIHENWLDENTCEVENRSNVASDYTVLKFISVPHKQLVDFKAIHLDGMEKTTVKF